MWNESLFIPVSDITSSVGTLSKDNKNVSLINLNRKQKKYFFPSKDKDAVQNSVKLFTFIINLDELGTKPETVNRAINLDFT